jgi:hypothetical protein
MQTARRLYVYLMTGISLGALVAGLMMLLGVLLDRLGLGPGSGVVFGDEESVRRQLTVGAALIAVSLPVWLIHWFVAERSVRPDRPGGLAELNTAERGLFFALVLGILLAVGASGLASAIHGGIVRLTGETSGFHDIADDLGRAVVAMTAWGYHVRVRARDWDRRTLTHQAAFLPRAYRYLATFVGLLIGLSGLTGLIELGGRLAVDERSLVLGSGAPWWAFSLAESTSAIVVGGLIWLGHWAFSTRLLAQPTARGASERTSRLRLAHLVAVIAVATGAALYFVADGLSAALRLTLGIDGTDPIVQAVVAIVVPLASAIPFAVAAWIHARWLRGEPTATETRAGADTADRLRLYPVALVALAFAAVGSAGLIGLLIEALFGRGALGAGDTLLYRLADYAPIAILGWGAWFWRWISITRRATADRAAEAASTTRRATLLIVLALSILAGIGAGGVILYRLFGSLFGVTLTGDPVSELSVPIGTLLVAGGLAATHGVLLRRDQALRTEAEHAGAPHELGTRSVRLRLTGPVDGLERALATLGGVTPDGYVLEIEPDPPDARAGTDDDAAAD